MKVLIWCMYDELEAHAPITKSMLLSCLNGHRESSATIKKNGHTKCRMADSAKIISVCCCILLRARSLRMNALHFNSLTAAGIYM